MCMIVEMDTIDLLLLVHSLSLIWLFVIPWIAAHQASLYFYLLEYAQTHVHWVDYANQSSHLLLSPSPPALNLTQHQGLSSEWALHIKWPKHWSFSFSISSSNEYSGLIPLGLTRLISLQFTGLSRVFSNTTVQKHQFFCAQPFCGPILTSIHKYWKNHSFDCVDFCQ